MYEKLIKCRLNVENLIIHVISDVLRMRRAFNQFLLMVTVPLGLD